MKKRSKSLPSSHSRESTVLVLGAGASRGVSYRKEMTVPSPLDRDYFDLLQRFRPLSNDAHTVQNVLAWAKGLSFEHWRSMEQSFYTLQSRAYLAQRLGVEDPFVSDDEVVTSFVNATGALLRAAHGRKMCDFHRQLIEPLGYEDTILTFNYDLVIERAMRAIPRISDKDFGAWLYAVTVAQRPNGWSAPWLLKLHGSFSWDYPTGERQPFPVRLGSWDELDEVPGFRRFKNTGTEYPIFLPFWDKRIERDPWVKIWRNAYSRLKKAGSLIVWGYSLPSTDLKALQLFRLASLSDINLCVIDIATQTQDRWRRLFPDSKFWSYSSIEEFLQSPPSWWRRDY